MKWKKLFLCWAMISAIICVFTSCASESKGASNASSVVSSSPAIQSAYESSVTPEPAESTSELGQATYQSVLDEYSQKIKDATPGLIEEYKSEAANNQDGLSGLAEIANSKVENLAEICNEGIEKMAELMYATGSGKMDEYQEWAGKLQDVYTNEAQKIMDTYTASAS